MRTRGQTLFLRKSINTPYTPSKLNHNKMARFRRYRNYNRRHRARWCSNIQEIETIPYVVNTGVSGDSITLVSNPVQLQTAVSQIYTVKNIECSFTFSTSGADAIPGLEDLAVYIMFVPQGMNLTNNYNLEHPEYIMAYKYIGSPSTEESSTSHQGQQYQPVKIKTRLARKLNSGDQIILFWKLRNQTGSTQNYELGGLVRWWTKAN